MGHVSRVCRPDAIDPSLCQANGYGTPPARYADGFRENLRNLPAVRLSFVRCDDANDPGATPCVGRGAGVAITLDEVWLFSDDLDGTSNLMENIILTGPDYILAHEDRTYNGASATNYCECQSEGTWSAEEDLYVTKGYGPQLPTDACLDCTFVGADAAAQLATLRQQPGFPAEMEAAIAAGHVYYGNAGVRSGSISGSDSADKKAEGTVGARYRDAQHIDALIRVAYSEDETERITGGSPAWPSSALRRRPTRCPTARWWTPTAQRWRRRSPMAARRRRRRRRRCRRRRPIVRLPSRSATASALKRRPASLRRSAAASRSATRSLRLRKLCHQGLLLLPGRFGCGVGRLRLLWARRHAGAGAERRLLALCRRACCARTLIAVAAADGVRRRLVH